MADSILYETPLYGWHNTLILYNTLWLQIMFYSLIIGLLDDLC